MIPVTSRLATLIHHACVSLCGCHFAPFLSLFLIFAFLALGSFADGVIISSCLVSLCPILALIFCAGIFSHFSLDGTDNYIFSHKSYQLVGVHLFQKCISDELISAPNLTSTSLQKMFRLFCWVKGDEPEQRFHVDIASTDTVSGLREAIKKKKEPTFDHVPADSLKLWKVRVQLLFYENYC